MQEKLSAHAEKRLQEMVSKLKADGKRLTPQRLAVLKTLAVSKNHPSVEDIYNSLKEDFPTMSIATVYKTVALLKEEGELQELNFGTAGSRYDGNKPFPHPHLVCMNCDTIIDLDSLPLEQMIAAVGKETGAKILHHRLDFFGICPSCKGKEKG
jgi:Fur family peroxide stress response transcriptional regulator